MCTMCNVELADTMFLSNVLTACGNFLSEQLHPSNCLGLALFAKQHRCEILLQKAKDYSLEHFMDVSKAQEFLRLNSEQLGSFLASDNLTVSAEENVFEILMTWMQHDQVEREKHKDQLLKLVRLPLLERSFLIKHVKPICTSIESQQLYIEALEWNSLPHQKIINVRKSINSDKFLMCLTCNSDNSRMQIHFYCPQRLQWMRCLKDCEYRVNFGVAVMNDNLYVVGGRSKENVTLNTVTCINLKTMAIGQINPMTERRMGCGVAVINGILYAVGGHDGKKSISSVEKWKPETNTWSEVASVSERRRNFGIAQLNKKLYVVGGFSISTGVRSAEYYDIHQNVWKSIAPMSERRQRPSVAVANGLLYVVSGSRTVERYDPQNNKWTMLCSLPQSNYCIRFCTTLCNKVVVCYYDEFYEYNDKSNEWETKETLNGIKDVRCLIAYSHELPVSEIAEN